MKELPIFNLFPKNNNTEPITNDLAYKIKKI